MKQQGTRDMSNGAVIGLGVGLILVLGAGFAALGGLPGAPTAQPNVALELAGGGTMSASIRAVVRQTGADGTTTVKTMVLVPLADGTLGLALPESGESLLTDIALVDAERLLWQVAPKILRLAAPDEGSPSPPLVRLVAEPESLRPFLHGPIDCTMALAGQNVALTRAPDTADITLSVNQQRFPLHQDTAGWTDAASGTTLTPYADTTAEVTLPDGSRAHCTPGFPAGLMPLALAGDGWQLQVDSTAIALLRSGHKPLVLAASGTLSQMTGDRLDAVHYRATAPKLGPDAPNIVATHATCTDNATGDQQSWRVTIGFSDGTELHACAGDPVRNGDGTWKLTALNAVYREFGGSLQLSARSFTADSHCHRHQGRVIRTGNTIRLERERRTDLGECPKRGLAMAEALDAAMVSGMEIRPDKRGGIRLVGIGDDLTGGVYIRAVRSGGS